MQEKMENLVFVHRKDFCKTIENLTTLDPSHWRSDPMAERQG